MSRDVPDETPWEPLSVRERLYFAVVRFLTWTFRVDFFDVYRRQEVRYDKHDDIYRAGMEPISDLKDEWLHTYKRQSKFYDDNDDDDWVDYTMWLVMRSDDTINPPVIMSGERQEDGSWEHDVDDGAPETKKQKRKQEILREVDERGFIDPVLPHRKKP